MTTKKVCEWDGVSAAPKWSNPVLFENVSQGLELNSSTLVRAFVEASQCDRGFSSILSARREKCLFIYLYPLSGWTNPSHTHSVGETGN